jgi:NAD(P)-dependent dehydrogenase (short-subunit alcohol dehydrogenase family)
MYAGVPAPRILSRMHLEGRAALITGGTRIGSSIAIALAARGVDVALSYHHSMEKAERTAAAIREHGRRSLVVHADLAEPAVCRDLVARTAEAFGRLDVLVALASVYERVPYDDLTEADWERNLAVDLRSSFACAHAAAPHMRAAGGGRIILFSDWVAASHRPRYRGYVPYYVAKAGIVALGEALALELAGDGILVNSIAPGPILPAASVDAKENEAVIRATPVGRWGGPEPIVQTVLTLLESDFITGETIQVDGGRHVS